MTMKRHLTILGIGLILFGTASDGSAQNYKKLAQSGLEFLNVKADARAMAMGGAVTTVDLGSGSLFFNPAGIAEMTSTVDLSISLNDWLADIRHTEVSAAFRPCKGRYGVFGVSLQNVDYGDLQWTMVDLSQDKGYNDLGKFSPSAFAVGLGYAKSLTDRFAIGGQVHWVRQQLGENYLPVDVDTAGNVVTRKESNEVSPVSFDFGTNFKTGFKSLAFGMSIRNFSKEYKFEREGFQLPLTFTMGVSANLLDWIGTGGVDQSLVASVDIAHYRSRPEQVMAGLNYTVFRLFSLRGGYVSEEDENSFSFGVGAGFKGVSFDYAYTPFGVFDSVQRITARASF
jgi:hypothetical protein